MMKRKSTKRALATSALAITMCTSMLAGTTYAWFTDTAAAAVNTIQSGTLGIQLLDSDGESLEGKTLLWQKTVEHEDEPVLWEPGCTYDLQPITIKNNGNLALKYYIVITGIQGDAVLNKAITWTVSNSNQVTDLSADQALLPGQSNTLTISGHMKEDAGNEYQGKQIDGITISVYATQNTVEYDSNSNQYDEDASYNRLVYSFGQMKAAMGRNGIITLGSNIFNANYLPNISGQDTNIVLNLNGRNLTGNDKDTTSALTAMDNATLTINGEGTVFARDIPIKAMSGGKIIINGGTYNKGDSYNGLLLAMSGGIIEINGGTFRDALGYESRTLQVDNENPGLIIIRGGSFYKFDPRSSNTEDIHEGDDTIGIKIAEGYKVVQDGDWYNVVPE